MVQSWKKDIFISNNSVANLGTTMTLQDIDRNVAMCRDTEIEVYDFQNIIAQGYIYIYIYFVSLHYVIFIRIYQLILS